MTQPGRNANTRPAREGKLVWFKRLRGVRMPRARKDVLLAIFDYASGDGTNAHPGTAKIAADTLIDKRHVRRHLRALEADGWLIVQSPGGNQYFKGAATVYALGKGPAAGAGQAETEAEDGTGHDDRKGGSFDTKGGSFNQGRGATGPTPPDPSPHPSTSSDDESSGSSCRTTDPSTTQPKRPVPPEDWQPLIDDYDTLEEWLEQNGIDLTIPSASSQALGMWGSEMHPLAIYNTLRKAAA